MKAIRLCVVTMLILIGINALIAGSLFIIDSSGALLYISIEQVGLTAFEDFLIPGILLFLFNGVLSIITAFFVIYRWKRFAEMVIIQGIILFLWIVAQIYFFDQVYLMQYVVLVTSLCIFTSGIILKQHQSRSNTLPD